MSERIPQTDIGIALHASLSPTRWARVVAEAEERVRIFDEVTAQVAGGGFWTTALAEVAPSVPWPTFVNWKRRHGSAQGESWERLLDRRPKLATQAPVDTEVVAGAIRLRQQNHEITCEAARSLLRPMFGAAGDMCDASLTRIWARAGLNLPPGRRVASLVVSSPAVVAQARGKGPVEEVTVLHGGGGLAFLAAAEAEFGPARQMADAILKSCKEFAALCGPFEGALDDSGDRDEGGRFTPAYAARWRAGVATGEPDARWTDDLTKALARNLQTCKVLTLSAPTLARHLLAIGASPLLTERRGLDGLDGPAGAWLAAFGGTAYMPATLDKTLAELGYLDVGPDMWDAHAKVWHRMTQRWAAPGTGWQQAVVYIDGTADPYWTQSFARSGKVSRVGRVMPCVSRICLNSGAGIPLLVETHAGAVSLRARVLPLLAQLDRAVGAEAQANRLTVIDSEGGTAAMLLAMHTETEMVFITVLKGQVLAGTAISGEGPWQKYRNHDELRQCTALVKGEGVPAEGVEIRAVQMRRLPATPTASEESVTTYATNGCSERLTTQQVADEYLKRWPKQEHTFRKLRNGGGLNRSHGYGGGYVNHLALVPKLEKARRSSELAAKRLTTATKVQGEVARRAKLKKKPSMALQSQAKRQVRSLEKQVDQKQKATEKLEKMPSEIYERDFGRDQIATCLKLMVMALLETVLKEYFGGLGMELPTFIEQFVALPVTMRCTSGQCVYEIEANPRQPEHMARLRRAVAEMNRRKLKQGKQLLRFVVISGEGS